MLARLQPGFLLLFWCGIAATIVAFPLTTRVRARERMPRRARALRLALDLLLFPLLYAVTFEIIGRADLLTGAGAGAAHAFIALVLNAARRGAASPPPTSGDRLRAFLARTLYGIVFAFLYVVPTP